MNEKPVPKNARLNEQKATRKKSKVNYAVLDEYLGEKTFDEKYALLSHYIHLQCSASAEKYRKILEQNGIDVKNLPSAKDFNSKLDVPFCASESLSFTFIDLFAGIGGFRLAMQSCGGQCVFSSEWDDAAKQTYFENYGEVPFGDITKTEIKDLIPKKFDVLCAGFPCQPFSYSGQKKGFEDKTRGTLFFEICEILKVHRPKFIFLENVKGLISHKNGETIATIRTILKDELGYDIHEVILSSLDFELPQKRERWYCVGFLSKTDFVFPAGTKIHKNLRDIIDLDNQDESLKLPKFELDRIAYHFEMAKNKTDRVKHDNSKYKPNTKKGKYGVYSFQKPDGSLRFHVGDVAKTQIQEAFYSCLDTYASTIIANRTPKLWDIGRKLSVRESLRLQGFPEKFRIPVSDNQAYKQLGNSVSVPVLEAISKKLFEKIKMEKLNV